jgi:hypothetical protein
MLLRNHPRRNQTAPIVAEDGSAGLMLKSDFQQLSLNCNGAKAAFQVRCQSGISGTLPKRHFRYCLPMEMLIAFLVVFALGFAVGCVREQKSRNRRRRYAGEFSRR